ncbi:SDR family oxidoreductase [Mycolicibacterium pyrenivorans]|uniref:SDR family oxidoreductase n=1 Tax=Mycolicibacterium pyrenivorans TaxID=187102 RepID=UPI0021F2B4A6|nr:SDR family oxidoreductase [Mycolicibacterium pyrenivorans]MCV7149821.1 SDR family oxidoreductase [Mycolicibacterium pyrenivorans]
MAASLKDASVVVFGGSSGMGLATARTVLNEGARVTIVGRNADRLDQAREELSGDVRRAALDVGDEAAVRDLFDGIDDVDHVVCFAGTSAFGPIVETDIATLRGTVDSRFWGPVYISKYAGARMTAGSLTFCTGSGVERPRPGSSILSAAASGAETFSRGMARELAPIRVNVVRPGMIDTPLIERTGISLEEHTAGLPIPRVGRPEEVAHAVVFLITNEFVTGVVLPVDGGAALV